MSSLDACIEGKKKVYNKKISRLKERSFSKDHWKEDTIFSE